MAQGKLTDQQQRAVRAGIDSAAAQAQEAVDVLVALGRDTVVASVEGRNASAAARDEWINYVLNRLHAGLTA